MTASGHDRSSRMSEPDFGIRFKNLGTFPGILPTHIILGLLARSYDTMNKITNNRIGALSVLRNHLGRADALSSLPPPRAR